MFFICLVQQRKFQAIKIIRELEEQEVFLFIPARTFGCEIFLYYELQNLLRITFYYVKQGIRQIHKLY